LSPKLLSRAEVAEVLSVSVRTIDRLREQGILPPVKVLTSVRFREEDVKNLVDSQLGKARHQPQAD
jgi:excisionase family DNA binding protein